MATPTIRVQVAFQNDPSLNPSWTDVTAYVRGEIGIHRGRQHELDRFEAGTAGWVLDNDDGRFSPTNAASPYYPYVLPMRRCRLSAVIGGLDYPLFDGFVEDWQPLQPTHGYHVVRVRAVDGFKVLALAKVTASFSSEYSHTRVNNVMDLVGWNTGQSWVLGDASYSLLGVTTTLGPVGDRDVGAGNSLLQAVTLDQVPALQHLQDVQGSENGLLFISREGALMFRGRHARVKEPYLTVTAEFTDDPTADTDATPYGVGTLVLDYGDDNLYNQVTITRQGGTAQTATDAASVTRYWPRTYTADSLVTTDNEAYNQAEWLLYQYATPRPVVTSVEVYGYRDPAARWALLLDRELGDRVRVKARPGGALVSQESWVEGIDIRATTDGEWHVRWALGPADTLTYWILDDPVASLLGVSTRLGY